MYLYVYLILTINANNEEVLFVNIIFLSDSLCLKAYLRVARCDCYVKE